MVDAPPVLHLNPNSGALAEMTLFVTTRSPGRLLVPAMTMVAAAGRPVVWTVLRLIPSRVALVPIPRLLPIRVAKFPFRTLMALTLIRTSSLTLLLSATLTVRRAEVIRATALLNGVHMALLAGLTL